MKILIALFLLSCITLASEIQKNDNQKPLLQQQKIDMHGGKSTSFGGFKENKINVKNIRDSLNLKNTN